ncbi:MAG: AIM24 family protein [Deltaproteobacteria bacterium]|nr:AIM24 family protein [Deltaproteobacteria bacterium]
MMCHEVDYEIIGDDIQIVEIELDPGETVVAEAGAMNYMDDGITFEAKMGDGSRPDDGVFGKLLGAGSLKSMFFGGEGLFLATLSGTGTVLLQSLPFSRMADRILQHAPAAGGAQKGEGSLLGGLGSLIGGDNT